MFTPALKAAYSIDESLSRANVAAIIKYMLSGIERQRTHASMVLILGLLYQNRKKVSQNVSSHGQLFPHQHGIVNMRMKFVVSSTTCMTVHRTISRCYQNSGFTGHGGLLPFISMNRKCHKTNIDEKEII